MTYDCFYRLQLHQRPVNDLSTAAKLTNQLLCFWADGGFFFLLQGPWFAILQTEIRSRWILREKVDCKQSSLGLMTFIIHNIFLNRV